MNISALELIEIGAGGGSIASIQMGLIQVGPQSAGAEPGPVCYARGGTLATITDANALLGYLAPEGFAGSVHSIVPRYGYSLCPGGIPKQFRCLMRNAGQKRQNLKYQGDVPTQSISHGMSQRSCGNFLPSEAPKGVFPSNQKNFESISYELTGKLARDEF